MKKSNVRAIVNCQQKGITLIALVVTVIVLLILAGVTLALITGSDGILGKASNAVDKNKIASAKEQVELLLGEYQADFFEKRYVTREETGEKKAYIASQLKNGAYTEDYYVEASKGDDKVRVHDQRLGDVVFLTGTIQKNGSIKWDDEVVNDTTEAPEKPVTPVAKYTVTYNANGGSGVPTDSKEYEKGATASVNFDTIPTRNGYSFLGWTDNESDKETAKYTSSGTKTFTMSEKNVTLYAVWKFEFVQGGTWTQDKINVTNGPLTLKVGSKVNGYSANGVSDWYVLGAKDGKLLITTNFNVTTVTLEGQDGYANGIATLNTKAKDYTNSSFAEGNARTIDVDDVNRVTGYDPDVANYNSGNNVDQWGNKVTYKNDNGMIKYSGTKYPTSETSSSYSSFTYWTGSTWELLENGENKTLTHTYYKYYPQTLTTSSSDGARIKDVPNSANAYNLLFNSDYYLGSVFVASDAGVAHFGVRYVVSGATSGGILSNSSGGGSYLSCGLRPVISLKSGVKVASDGSLSL